MKKQIKTKFGTITCSDTNIKWDLNKTKLKIKTNALDLEFPGDLIISIGDECNHEYHEIYNEEEDCWKCLCKHCKQWKPGYIGRSDLDDTEYRPEEYL
jgi:hypothetical protein